MAQLGSLSVEIDILHQVSSLVEAFRAFDVDNDDCITAAELGGILGSLGFKASVQDVRAMMQQGDTNKDGLLSIQEFLEMNAKDMELGGLANLLKSAFAALEVDDNDVVTGEELYESIVNNVSGLSLEDCHGIVRAMDRDGAVGVEDFELIVNSLL